MSRAPTARLRPPTADTILIGLLETVIDRVADMMEAIAADLDGIANDIFSASDEKKPIATHEFKELLRRIGAAGDLASRTRESLATLDRMIPFLQLVLDGRKAVKEARARTKAMNRDVHSLNDFVSFLSNKTTFLLDTTVGMISIEQNAIIKIFSVAAVGFMPPTLVASIYGMNFAHMPELSWPLGYPMALGIMVLSAIIPLLFFRYKRWL
jgi:magnesium transporter